MVKLIETLLNALYSMAQFSLVLCGLVAFANVALRFLFNAPLYWGEEITVLFLLWIIFLAQGQLEANDDQLCMTAIYSLLSDRVKRVMDAFRLVVTVFVTLYLAYVTLEVVREYYNTNTTTYTLHIPLWILYSIFSLSLVCMALGRCLGFYRKLARERGGENK